MNQDKSNNSYQRRQHSPSARPASSSSSSYRSPARRSPRPASSSTPRPQPRQHSIWPSLFTGCALGVILAVLALAITIVTGIYSLQNGKVSIPMITPTKQTISMEEIVVVPLNSISQIVVCNVIGDVVLKTDPTVNNPTVTITKKVQASNQAEADQEFREMAVTVQPPGTVTGPLSCTRLQATATPDNATLTPTSISNRSLPATAAAGVTSNSLIANVTFPAGFNRDMTSIDLTIAIPPNALPTTGPSTTVNVESAGNISVDGISGILNIKDDSGNPQNKSNITVTHAALADGSRLSTSGAITFNGYLAEAPDANKTAYYILEGEQRIDVTLPSNINVTLDAYAVSGSINSQFPLQQNLLQKDQDTTSYHGPLNASTSPPVNAQLTLHVGIGNVNIHEAQAPQA